jgi:hypothetical protein
MARASNGTHKVKMEEGDIVVGPFGVKAKVQQIMVIPSLLCVDGVTDKHVDILLTVDTTRGKGEPSVWCIEEVEAIWMDGAWVNRMGEPVEV